MQQGTSQNEQVIKVARIARDFAHLPGAATPDWCRRAAAILTGHDPTTRAWVMVLRSGASRQTEATGYSEGSAARAEPTPERLALALVRAVTEGLGEVTPPAVFSIGGLIDSLRSPPWGTGQARKHGHILAGVAEVRPDLCEGAQPRVLTVFWDRPSALGSTAPDDLRLVLTSVLSVASERLSQALRGTANPWLSECEQRVLDMLTEGLSVPEIAEALGRSPHTIHDHVKRLHAKLGTRSRGALLARVLGHQPPIPPRPIRNGRPIAPFRSGVFVDHGAR